MILAFILIAFAAYMGSRSVKLPTQTSHEKPVQTLDTEPKALEEEGSREPEAGEEDNQA